MKSLSYYLLACLLLLQVSACHSEQKQLTRIEYYGDDDLLIAQCDYAYDENQRLINLEEKFWTYDFGFDSIVMNYSYTYFEDKIGLIVNGNPTPDNYTYILDSDSNISVVYMNSLKSIIENKKDSLFCIQTYLDNYMTSQTGIFNAKYVYEHGNIIESSDWYGKGRIEKISYKYSDLDDKTGVSAVIANPRGYYKTQPTNPMTLFYLQGFCGNKSQKVISSIVVENQTSDGRILSSNEITYDYIFTKKGYITEVRPSYTDPLSMGRFSIYSYCKLYYQD